MQRQSVSSSGYTRLILAAGAAGILVAGVGSVLWAGATRTAPPPAPTADSAAAPPSAYSFPETAAPARLLIPKIGVDAPVEGVGVAADGLMAVTRSYFTVGWYRQGPVPGAPGSAVMEGHLDQLSSPYAVFYDLDKLRPGDEVGVVDIRGRTVRFVVTGSQVYPYTASPPEVFQVSPESRLNLVTCAGTWLPAQNSYDRRLVVFTKRAID